MLENDTTILYGNWLPFNKARLEKLIGEKAFAGNYAVFDWDFTCIFFDTQDNLFLYQLENLCFNLTPEQFSVTIRKDIPQTEPFKNHTSVDGALLTAQKLSDDVENDYRFLYASYKGLNGNASLTDISKTDEYADFKTKLIKLMWGARTVSNVDIAQSVSTGLTLPELQSLTEKSIDRGLTDKIEEYTIRSPFSCPGKAGIVETFYRKGMRIQPEIQNLLAVLNKNGIETYVCSASQEYPIRVFASNPKYGYCVKPENVFGQRRMFDSAHKITDEHDRSIPPTRKEGKAETIRKCIAPKHGGKAPVLVAGDGDGDFYMMDAFKTEALLLIFNRNQDPKTRIYGLLQKGQAERGKQDTGIIVQNRNEAEGTFCRQP